MIILSFGPGMGWQWALLMLLGGVLVGELPSLLASLVRWPG